MAGEVLKNSEKILYSNGDSKSGSELVSITKMKTTTQSNTEAKPVKCVKYKTLCDALKELAAIEQKKGTEKFIKDIIDRDKLIRGELVINHNPIIGGGDPNDKEIEDTEFKDPRLPYFIDIEYIEVGYALSKQWISPGLAYGAWTLIGKPAGRAVEEQRQKNPITDYNYRPNRIGTRIGRMIANNYENIADFVSKFCTNECSSVENDAFKKAKEIWY